MRNIALIFYSMALCAFSLPVTKAQDRQAGPTTNKAVQGQSINKANYQAKAQRESMTMKQRYRLSAEQQAEVEKLNGAYYLDLSTVLENEKEPAGRARKIKAVQQAREEKLKSLFSPEQYGVYRRDMDAMAAKATKRAEAQRSSPSPTRQSPQP